MGSPAGILVIVLTILIVVLMAAPKSPAPFRFGGKEGYGNVLGALGPYEAQLAAALDQTNQSDPSKRLQPWPAYNAGSYIQSAFTDMAKRGVPPKRPVTIGSVCKERCRSADPLSSQKCEGVCVCHKNVARSCSIDCSYTDEPVSQCMAGCMATKLTNCNQFSWVFYDH